MAGKRFPYRLEPDRYLFRHPKAAAWSRREAEHIAGRVGPFTDDVPDLEAVAEIRAGVPAITFNRDTTGETPSFFIGAPPGFPNPALDRLKQVWREQPLRVTKRGHYLDLGTLYSLVGDEALAQDLTANPLHYDLSKYPSIREVDFPSIFAAAAAPQEAPDFTGLYMVAMGLLILGWDLDRVGALYAASAPAHYRTWQERHLRAARAGLLLPYALWEDETASEPARNTGSVSDAIRRYLLSRWHTDQARRYATALGDHLDDPPELDLFRTEYAQAVDHLVSLLSRDEADAAQALRERTRATPWGTRGYPPITDFRPRDPGEVPAPTVTEGVPAWRQFPPPEAQARVDNGCRDWRPVVNGAYRTCYYCSHRAATYFGGQWHFACLAARPTVQTRLAI